jgi:hypothetical protein
MGTGDNIVTKWLAAVFVVGHNGTTVNWYGHKHDTTDTVPDGGETASSGWKRCAGAQQGLEVGLTSYTDSGVTYYQHGSTARKDRQCKCRSATVL